MASRCSRNRKVWGEIAMNEEDFWNFISDFTELLSAMEESRHTELNAIRKLKEQIAKLAGVSEDQSKPRWSWDPSKIKWEKAEGAKGLFERSEDVDNPEFKAMLKDLASHKGKLTRDGVFYWVYRNGSTVGRKPQNRGGFHE